MLILSSDQGILHFLNSSGWLYLSITEVRKIGRVIGPWPGWIS